MPNTCFVPNCDNGQRKRVAQLKAEGKKIPSMFRPKANTVDAWRRAIPRKDKVLTLSSWVCINHFMPKDVEFHWEHVGPEVKIIKIEKERPTLKDGAILCQFNEEGTPKYLSKTMRKRKPPTDRSISEPPLKKRVYRERKSQWEDVSTSVCYSNQEPPDVHLESGSMGNCPKELPSQVPIEDISTKEHMSNEDQAHSNIEAAAKDIKLPSGLWGIHMISGELLRFCHIDLHRNFDKCIEFQRRNNARVFVRNKETDMKPTINCREDLEKLLQEVHKLRLCDGAEENQFSKYCKAYVPDNIQTGPKSTRCFACRQLRENLIKRRKRLEKKSKRTSKMTPLAKRSQQRRRLLKKVKTLEDELQETLAKYKNIEANKIEDMFKHLPPKQQAAIMPCVRAGKAKTPAGLRYNAEWVYECILLRIKGPKLYRSMRRDKLLPLPSPRTLQRYIKKLSPSYGFQVNVFSLLQEKCKHMTPAERHGSLLLDEMELSEGIAFSKTSLNVNGLVDLGKHTPEDQKTTMGDHALVLMFQPFRGAWIQAVAAFCSKGAAKGEHFEKIILEAVLLLEKAGLFVDEIVTDGGAWNRAMWKLFGISESQRSCIHPVDKTRRLCFASDFPHLMKSMWSRVRKQKLLQTPDGDVKINHWERLIQEDANRQIKRNHFFTKDHLYPQYYQTMSVSMAFTFFCGKVASVMREYRDKNATGFEDSLPTILLIEQINSLGDAMNSRLPWEALRSEENSKNYKDHIVVAEPFLLELHLCLQIIENFIEFLTRWRKMAKAEYRFTNQTYLGLIVTLKGTLQLIKYLSEEVGYKYLMTRRINQDALEHFFGNMRQACGSNPHPDPIQFIQLYRLLSTHSLIKPPRGRNVSGGDMLKTLLTLQDVVGAEEKKRRVRLEKELDEILDNGEFDIFDPYFDTATTRTDIDPPALMNFTGYVVQKATKCSYAKNCKECLIDLLAKEDREPSADEDLIHYRSHGHLFVPSDQLMEIIYRLETAVLNVVQKEVMDEHLLFEVVDEVSKMGIPSQVGCQEHKREMTKWIMDFYLKTRMIFACKRHMKKAEDRKKKEKLLRKQSKV